jgi:enoyl-CoA hydratase
MLRRSCLGRSSAITQFGRFAVTCEPTLKVLRVEMRSTKQTGGSANLMDAEFFASLRRTFDWISMEYSGDVRAVVLHASLPKEGGGRTHFSCGLDLKSVGPKLLKDLPMTQTAKLAVTTTLGMRAPTTLSEPGMPAMRAMELRQVIRQWQEAVTSIANCRVPVIAAVHGLCLGGGVDVTSACDMRFASAESEMSIKEANVGIVADMGSLARVGRIVGEGIMREWAYTGRNIKAAEAERRGYYNAVLPTPQECLNHALQVATEIGSASSPIAVQGTKAVLNHESEAEARRGLEYVQLWNAAFLKHDDLIEAAVAFAQKRRPEFAGVSRLIDDRAPLPKSWVKTEGSNAPAPPSSVGISVEEASEVVQEPRTKTTESTSKPPQ